MALPITVKKILKGVIVQDINDDATYEYSLPEAGINSVQNAISSANAEEVFIISTGASFEQFTILPPISSFRGGYSPKIYFCNFSPSSKRVYAYNNEIEVNTVNGQTFGFIPSARTGYFRIVNNNRWAYFPSKQGILSPPF
jgi:hypothetical protein